MSVEVSIICDTCGGLLAADKTAARARYAVKDMGGRVSLAGGFDVCRDCLASPSWQADLARWRTTVAAE